MTKMKKMYRIDWEKYLVEDREKPTSVPGAFHAQGIDKRNAFESDFGRVMFSSALRRMHDKTQVIPLSSGDYVHTRLTHSMEVMNIAGSIGLNLCRHDEFKELYGEKANDYEKKIDAILRTAAIVHDIGNPPFGHFGEKAIQNYFSSENGKVYLRGVDNSKRTDFEYFDGNAQGLRVMSKLQYLGDLYGLNLTYGTLAAYIKYPNIETPNATGYVGQHKHGVFYSEYKLMSSIKERCSLILTDKSYLKRHPLVFLVEAADTICYSIMDIEDALSMEWIDFDCFRKKVSEMLLEKIKNMSEDKRPPRYKDLLTPDNKGIDVDKLVKFSYDNNKLKKKNIVDFRVKVVQYLVEITTSIFIDKLEDIDNGRYDTELLKDDPYCLADILGEYARAYIFSKKEIMQLEITGETVIKGLLDNVLRYVFSPEKQYRKRIQNVMSQNTLRLNILEQESTNDLKIDKDIFGDDIVNYDIKNLNPYNKLHLVVDWISGMTDKYALEMYQKLSGVRL